jgi:hypothetical protein
MISAIKTLITATKLTLAKRKLREMCGDDPNSTLSDNHLNLNITDEPKVVIVDGKVVLQCPISVGGLVQNFTIAFPNEIIDQLFIARLKTNDQPGKVVEDVIVEISQ